MKNSISLNFFILLIYILVVSTLNSYSQDPRNIPNPGLIYREAPDDKYIPNRQNGHDNSPGFNFNTPRISTYQVNVNDFGLNILGDAANEPSIAIDPNNPNRIFIGWRQFDNVSSNFRQAGNGYSLDGGKTWNVPSPIQAGVFHSDPVLDADSKGTIYFNSLGSNFSCKVFKAASNNIWDNGTNAHGGDKQWMTIDKRIVPNGVNNNIYSYWSQNYSICSPNAFTRSVDNGLSYEECSMIPDGANFGNLAIGINGELFLCGQSNGFSVSKSSNAWNTNQDVIWDFTRNVDLDGWLGIFIAINPEGLLGPPWIGTDISDSPTKGNVYLLSTVSRKSKNDNADVMFTKSTDGGLSWVKPIQINDDSLDNNWNWFGTMSVAQNGRIDVVWLDTRHDPGGFNSKLYYSTSSDGGVNWSKNEALSNSFDPHIGWPNQKKMGDYFHMISDNKGAHLACCATFNGEQDVYYSFIPADSPTEVKNYDKADESIASLSQNAPNPFSEFTSIKYSIRKDAKVRLEILDLTLNTTIKLIVDENKLAGDYIALWNGKNNSELKVPNGIYFYRLHVGTEKFIYRKMLLLSQ